MHRLICGAMALALAACACKSKPATVEGGGGASGSGTGTAVAAASCDDAKAPVTALYEAEAKATDQASHDPTFVEDNVAMVMKDCAKDPARVVACAKAAPSVAKLEQDCLAPLDEEGTEGERVGK